MFSFNAWKTVQVGSAGAIAMAFERVYEAVWRQELGIPKIRFELVDVRQGPFTSDEVEQLIERFAKLLLSNEALLGNLSAKSRLLFIGDTRTLATPHAESPGIRAIKQDLEFYIRVLQNYGVAHYADIGRGDIGADASDSAIKSALMGMVRHYTDQGRRPDKVKFQERVREINGDFVDLTKSARKLHQFRFVGSVDKPNIDENQVSYFGLLREIGLVYQFGKGERIEAHGPKAALQNPLRKELRTFDVALDDSSYDLYVGMLDTMGEWAKAFHVRATTLNKSDKAEANHQMRGAANSLAKRSFKLARYELLRDIGRMLGQGTLLQFRTSVPDLPVLLIDDEIYGLLKDYPHLSDEEDTKREPLLTQMLQLALESVNRSPTSVHVVPSEYVDAKIGLMQADGLSKLINGQGQIKAFNLRGEELALSHDLGAYAAVVIDPESRRDACGPVRVQRLHAFLQHHLKENDKATDIGRVRSLTPPVVAFSRKESSGYVQQCLNMGAAAFVSKTRPYQLLFALSRVLKDERNRQRSSGQASQFRILNTVKPHVAAKLLRKRGPSFIHGGMTLKDQTHLVDPREARWIDSLPKADLHYHFGTAIDCEIVDVLAMNTVGHFLAAVPVAPGAASCKSGASPLLSRIAKTLALTLRLERAYQPLSRDIRFSRLELMAAAAAATVATTHPKRSLENHSFGLGDAIVSHLIDPNDRCDDVHGTALLVAMMACRKTFSLGEGLEKYLGTLEVCARKGTSNTDVEDIDGDGPNDFTPQSALILEMERAYVHFNRVACRWSGSCSMENFKALTRMKPDIFWEDLRKGIVKRVRIANVSLRRVLNKAIREVDQDDSGWHRATAWLKEHCFSLQTVSPIEPDTPLSNTFKLSDYVTVPDLGSERGLQTYLRGADLLGSSHLQYPENLWLATFAITRDNADQNIIYSEVRCETTGYAKAGMGAHDATELLRHGFNLASLYIASLPRSEGSVHNFPLVRTNVLLAAKRHKKEADARAVVQLLEAYLERRAPVSDSASSRRMYLDKFGATMPPWWRPADVVGFDLSGDESRDEKWLRTVIAPLAARSSPVTIHAGEAASAESIWRAVYELNALRIGHGLRLTEDTALLGYCVREGICMELCPNSNRYTNQLDPHPRQDLDGEFMPSPRRYEYPLLQYLSHGMEVSLGTDNRYLHLKDSRTLTSEYLTAAELVGGLTRWEVLQIVKAGFKNAFLDKSEVRALIDVVEQEIYRIVATEYEQS